MVSSAAETSYVTRLLDVVGTTQPVSQTSLPAQLNVRAAVQPAGSSLKLNTNFPPAIAAGKVAVTAAAPV